MLIERLNETPEDAELRDEIRQFDLLARKAYFTNNWQIKTGGYLLLMGIIILLISLQIIDSNKDRFEQLETKEKEKYFLTQKKARKWIAIGGVIFAILTLFFAYLSSKKLNREYTTDKKENYIK